MIKQILRIYSAIFRYAGLAMATLSVAVAVWIAIGIGRDGYILVNGHPSRDFVPIATAVCTPLLGVVIGLALFLCIARARPLDGKGGEASRPRE